MSQMKKLDEKDLKKILKYYADGYSMGAIATKFGVSKITIRYHLGRMKAKIRTVSDYFKKDIP